MQEKDKILLKRFSAHFVDYLFKVPIIFFMFFVFYFNIFTKLHNPDFFFHPERILGLLLGSFLYNPIYQLGLLYFIVITGLNFYFMTNGQTIGKKILKLEVVSIKNYETFSFLKMFLRETFGKYISGSFFAIGFIWVIINDNNQTWHDLIFDSIVVEK
jgi:uncharacterized RDD family membrane protein YckC